MPLSVSAPTISCGASLYLAKKYSTFDSYKEQAIEDVFSPEQLESSVVHLAYMLESAVVMSNGTGGYDIRALPRDAQISPVYAILLDDLDKDGHVDITLGGNLYNVKPEVGRYDASYGLFLKGKGDGNFDVVPSILSGLMLEGEVRDFENVNVANERVIVVARNNDTVQLYTFKEAL